MKRFAILPVLLVIGLCILGMSTVTFTNIFGPYSLKKDTCIVSAEYGIKSGDIVRTVTIARDTTNGRLLIQASYQGIWGDSVRIDTLVKSLGKGYMKYNYVFTADSILSMALPPITFDTTGRWLIKQDLTNFKYRFVYRQYGSIIQQAGTIQLQKID